MFAIIDSATDAILGIGATPAAARRDAYEWADDFPMDAHVGPYMSDTRYFWASATTAAAERFAADGEAADITLALLLHEWPIRPAPLICTPAEYEAIE